MNCPVCINVLVCTCLHSDAAALWLWPEWEKQTQVYGTVPAGSAWHDRHWGSGEYWSLPPASRALFCLFTSFFLLLAFAPIFSNTVYGVCNVLYNHCWSLKGFIHCIWFYVAYKCILITATWEWDDKKSFTNVAMNSYSCGQIYWHPWSISSQRFLKINLYCLSVTFYLVWLKRIHESEWKQSIIVRYCIYSQLLVLLLSRVRYCCSLLVKA